MDDNGTVAVTLLSILPRMPLMSSIHIASMGYEPTAASFMRQA